MRSIGVFSKALFTGGILIALILPSPVLADEMEFSAEKAYVPVTMTVKVNRNPDRDAEARLEADMARQALRDVMDWIRENAGAESLKANYHQITARILDNRERFILGQERFEHEYRKIGGFLWMSEFELTSRMKFTVAKDELMKELTQTIGVLGDLHKYDIYVELYWDEKRDLDPAVVNACRDGVEKLLADQQFRVVKFEAIRDKILAMQLEEKENLEAGDLAELEDFRRNFQVSLGQRLDGKRYSPEYDRGLKILADYVQILVGVNIRNLETVNGRINLNLALEAYLIEGGQYQKLGGVDEPGSTAYIAGSKVPLLRLASSTSEAGARELALQMRDQLLKKQGREEKRVEKSFRVWRITFPGHAQDEVFKIAGVLRGGELWKYKGADMQKKTIEVEFMGLADDLAMNLYETLFGMDLINSTPEYTYDNNVIAFRKTKKKEE